MSDQTTMTQNSNSVHAAMTSLSLINAAVAETSFQRIEAGHSRSESLAEAASSRHFDLNEAMWRGVEKAGVEPTIKPAPPPSGSRP